MPLSFLYFPLIQSRVNLRTLERFRSYGAIDHDDLVDYKDFVPTGLVITDYYLLK